MKILHKIKLFAVTVGPFPFFIVLMLLLAGCTAAIVDQGVDRARQFKDAEAEVLTAAICAMSIGAYHRLDTPDARRALDVLCGGEWERPVTIDDLRRMLK